MNSSVGIIGTRMITKSVNGDSEKIEITNTGSMNSYHIPAVLVFCEDELAKEIIIKSFTNNSHCSFKFITCGSWNNIIISLAGSLLYSNEMKKTGVTKYIDVVGVIDGDISEKDILNTIKNCFKGNWVPSELLEITKQIRNHITHFNIPEDILNMKYTKGKPELNLKLMLEGVQEEKIKRILSPRIKKLSDAYEKIEEEFKPGLYSEIHFLKKELEETLKVIEISKAMTRDKFEKTINNQTITDYHLYLKKIKNKFKSQHFQHYDYTHYPLLILTRIIIKFDKQRWDEYVSPVVSFLMKFAENQRERYSHNTFNNHVID